MTLNGVMALFCVISPNLVVSGAHCVKQLKIQLNSIKFGVWVDLDGICPSA